MRDVAAGASEQGTRETAMHCAAGRYWHCLTKRCSSESTSPQIATHTCGGQIATQTCGGLPRLASLAWYCVNVPLKETRCSNDGPAGGGGDAGGGGGGDGGMGGGGGDGGGGGGGGAGGGAGGGGGGEGGDGGDGGGLGGGGMMGGGDEGHTHMSIGVPPAGLGVPSRLHPVRHRHNCVRRRHRVMPLVIAPGRHAGYREDAVELVCRPCSRLRMTYRRIAGSSRDSRDPPYLPAAAAALEGRC